MADLIQIGIDVNTNIKQATADLDKMGGSVVNNIRTIDRLESEVKQLNNALSKGSATEAAYAKGMRQINNELSVFQQRAAKAAQIERKFGSAAASGGKSMNRFNVALQQGGFQLQDFAVQLQSGTSFFTAFGQQGSQFAGIFGPQGAVIGAVIAIGSAIGGIAAKSLIASRSVKDFGEQLEETSSVMEDYISLASKSDEVFASLFKSSKTALSQTSQAAKDLLLIAKTEALDSIRGLGKALSDTSTEAGFWAKVMFNTDRTVTGNLLNIDTQLKGNITAWKNTGKEVQAFIDQVRNIGKADSIDGMYQSALKARDIFKQTVDVTGEMTEDQKSFWKELSTTILNLETMGATVEAMNGSWSDTSEAVDAATASMKLFYEYAERDAEAQDKRTAAVNKIKDALANTLLIESRRIEIAQAGANLDEVLAKHAREDFILSKKKEGIIGNNLVIALKAYDNAVASLKAEEDRKATLDQRGEAERALARANAAYAKAAAAADAKAKTEAQKLLDLQIRISATPAYEPMSALAIEAEKSQAEMIKIFQTSAALKEELGESAFEALRLGGVDLSNVDDASKSAALLAARLGYSYEEAVKLRELSADPLNAFGGAGPFIPNYVDDDDKDKKKLKNINDVIAALREQTDQETNLLGLTGERRTEEEIFYQLVQENAKADVKVSKDKLRAIAKEIAAQKKANEVIQKGIDFAKDLGDAFTDFIMTGFKDFKSFVSSIGNMFKQVLAQMVSQALTTKIFMPITAGFTGTMLGSAAGGATGSMIAGGAGGGGMLAGMGAAAAGLSSGFMGVMSGGGLGASFANLGGLMSGSVGGLGAIGAAIPAIAAVAVVIGLLSKKTKLLDSGLRTTVEGFDVAIETFKKTQSSRLFGLLKSRAKTGYEAASAEVADPLIEAIGNMQQSIVDAAGTLGIGADAFDDFSYQFKLSLKGLTEEEQLQKINEEITKMGDSFASLTGIFDNMNDLLAVAQQRLGLETQLLQMQGDIVELRRMELETVHVLNRDLAARIQLLQAEGDLQGALGAFAAGISEQQSLIRRAVDALVAPLVEAIDRTRTQAEKSYQIFRAAADKTRDEAENIVDIITGALESRTIRSEAVERMRYTQAQQQLASFAGGASFDEASLSRAVEGVSIDTTKFFGSFEDYARDFYKTQISLTKLAEKAEGELTDVEKQIDIADKAYQVAMGTYQEAQDFNVALNNLLTDLATFTEVAARNEPFIDQIKAEGDRQVELLDEILVETTKQINALLGIDNTIADLVGSNVSVGEALSVLGLEGGELAGAVFALEPTIGAIGSHIEDLDLTLGGAIDRLGLNLQDIIDLDLTAGFENLDLFAPLANIDFGEQLQPVVDIVNTLQELDLSGPLVGQLALLSELDLSGPLVEQLALLSELDVVGDLKEPLSGLTTKVSALDTAASGLNLGVVGLDGTVGVLSSSVDKQADSVLTLNGTVIKQTVAVDALTGEVTNLNGTVVGLGTNVSDLGMSTDSLGTNVSDLGMSTGNLGIDIGNLGTTLANSMSGLGSIVSSLSGAVSGLAASNNALASAQASKAKSESIASTTANAAEIAAALEAVVVPEVVEVVASKYRSGFFGDKASTATLSTGEVFSTKAGSGDQERLNAVKLAQDRADELNLARNAPLAEKAKLEAELEAMRQDIRDLGGVPTFASGGMHSGGMRLVGERGPELEVTGPSRIYSAQQTKSLMSGGSGEVVVELRSLRREVSELKSEQRKVGVENVKYNKKSYDLYREWDTIGLPATRTS